MKKLVLGKFSSGKYPQENTDPAKFLPGIFPPISLIAFLHLTLRFDKCSET